MSDTITVTSRMDGETVERLDRLADKCGTTRSDMVYRMCANTLSEFETLTEAAKESPLVRLVARLTACVISSKGEREELDRLLDALREHRREHDPNQMKLKVEFE